MDGFEKEQPNIMRLGSPFLIRDIINQILFHFLKWNVIVIKEKTLGQSLSEVFTKTLALLREESIEKTMFFGVFYAKNYLKILKEFCPSTIVLCSFAFKTK